MEGLRSSCNLRWLTLDAVTRGWHTWLTIEAPALALLCTIVLLVDWLLGEDLCCQVTHVLVIVLTRRFLAGGICSSSKRLDGRTVVVTGCNVGIGRETVRDLSARGGRIIMACRDVRKAEKVAAEIRAETGGQVEAMALDLASLASVRTFVQELKAKVDKLDVLVNNAGVMCCPYQLTEDGFEMQFGTNHLGHFLLTNLLLPLLHRAPQARVVTLSSLAHTRGVIPLNDLTYANGYERFQAYANSKLANILFTRHLAKLVKGSNMKVFAVHPGAVQSSLARHMTLGVLGSLGSLGSSWGAGLILKTTREGAQTSIHCVVEAEEDTETYYFSDCAPNYASCQARDDHLADQLWQVSAQLVGL